MKMYQEGINQGMKMFKKILKSRNEDVQGKSKVKE